MAFAILAILGWFGLLNWIDNRLLDQNLEAEGAVSTAYPNDHVSILIAFKDEESNLPRLLQSIISSASHERRVDIILVNDHSRDNGVSLIDAFARELPASWSLQCLQSEGEGKKAAILHGLKFVKSSWVYFTDADCLLQTGHIELMLQMAALSERKIVFGPVLYFERDGSYPMQRIENVNTQAVTEAFLQIGKPMMVNGANMLVHHSKLDQYIASQRMDYPGGDDVFFAQSLKREDYAFKYDYATAIFTNPSVEMKSWINQRIRWVHKSKAYKYPAHLLFSAFFGALMVLFSFMIISLLFQNSILNTHALGIVLFWLIPFFFHKKWALKWKVSIPFISHLVLTLIYPFYTLFLFVITIIPVGYNWKNRTYKSANWKLR